MHRARLRGDTVDVAVKVRNSYVVVGTNTALICKMLIPHSDTVVLYAGPASGCSEVDDDRSSKPASFCIVFAKD